MAETTATTKSGAAKKSKSKSKAKKKRSAKSKSKAPKRVSTAPLKGLVIVESPAKAKTIKKYLGKGYSVKASVGHIKDLPKSKLGVAVDNDFEPVYEVIKGKSKTVEELKLVAARAEHVYLAADPDREGEAIAWHVANELNMPEGRIHRVLINEITKESVLEAIQNPGVLNKDRFESQQARRILDRLVGYKISPLLWTKVRRGLSAGRVQSVAVRVIVDREAEIKAFQPQPYWLVEGTLNADGAEKDFLAKLAKIDGKRVDRLDIKTQEMADEIVEGSKGQPWVIKTIQKKERRRKPLPPFITSTMQQEASKKLYFTAKKTMRMAQQLYEGMEIGDEEAQGLITYMRTDSLRLSESAVKEARETIASSLGKEYVPKDPIIYKNKGKAQDAHEAVRPTSTKFTPEFVKPFLEKDQFRLYELIWKRFLACQAENAVFDQTTIEFEVKAESSKVYDFRTTGSFLKFPGFLALWQTEEDKNEDQEVYLPELTEASKVKCKEVKADRHETQPPPRYSESSLIKELEEQGIGRPSTYAAILSTIQDRKYVEKRENRFYPTDLGTIVTELLVENFKDIVDIGFTANMESQLDQIEEGSRSWVKTLKDFYIPFEKTLELAKTQMRDVKREETPTDLKCPKCDNKLVIKWGKNGKFIACLGYPECRFTSEFEQSDEGVITLVKQQVVEEKCEKCQSDMVIKMGRFGRFLACSAYPKCKNTKAITTGIKCPDCGDGELAEKRTRFGKPFYSCTKYPKCKYAIWDKPLKGSECPQCKKVPFLVEKYTKKDGASVRCPDKECGFRQSVDDFNEAATATGTSNG